MRAAGLQGPMQSETATLPDAQTFNFVEMLATKSIADTAPALNRMVTRIENLHKCKAVYRIHADRAQELTRYRIKNAFAARGIEVTNTAGYESNANGRAECALRFFQEKAMTLCSARIRSEIFQEQQKR